MKSLYGNSSDESELDDERVRLNSRDKRNIEAVWGTTDRERIELSQTQMKFLESLDSGYKNDYKMFRGSPKKIARPFYTNTQRAIMA